MRFSKWLFILIALLLSAPISAQYVKVRDLEGWLAMKQRIKAKDWSFSLEEQARFEKDMSQLGDVLAEIETAYAGLGDFEIGVGARGIRHLTASGDFENRFRFHLQTGYELDLGKSDLEFRVRYQTRYDLDEIELLNVMRLKTSYRFNPNNCPVDPYASLEGFFILPGRESFGFPSARLAFGGIWKITPTHHIRLFYHLEWANEAYYPLWINRFGLRYDLRL